VCARVWRAGLSCGTQCVECTHSSFKLHKAVVWLQVDMVQLPYVQVGTPGIYRLMHPVICCMSLPGVTFVYIVSQFSFTRSGSVVCFCVCES